MLWEPDTILQTGNALKILTSEVLSSAGQQILGATIMTGLMAGIAIPVCACAPLFPLARAFFH